jgi:2'-5' RNA ligase
MTRDGKRLFVGLRVSVATANALGGCAETLARRARDAGVDFRWVAPTNYHMTLKFLGWTGLEAIGAVTGISRLTFRTTRLGGFPALEKATVLWAGVEDQGTLALLAAAIDRETATLGFAPDKRAFHPHVTLARLREPRAIRDVVLPLAEQMFGDTRIDGVTLFESETKSSGPVYRELARIGFKPAGEAENRQRDGLEQGTPDREPDTDDGWPSIRSAHHDEF